ncbi:LysO family transporter [Emergencia timonensis]
MEAIGLCGATAMGVCLPIVEKSTRGDVTIYSFISGLIQTVSVPILIPLILG